MWRFALALAGCGFSAALPGSTPGDGDVEGTGSEPVVPRVGYWRSIDLTDALVSGMHAQFPLVVELRGDWVKSMPNGGRVAHDDGRDIVFSLDVDGTQPLVHDVEVYMPVEGVLIAWISVTSLAPSTVLYVHYGDPAATPVGDPRTVWTSAGYAGVWHLHPSNNDASGQSSTFSPSNAQVTNGRIAAGRLFDGMTGEIDVGSAEAIDNVFEGGGTVEAWFRIPSYGENGAARILDKGAWLITFGTGGALRFFYDWTGIDGDWRTLTAVSLNQWHHVAIVYDGNTNATIYLDGTASTQPQSPNGLRSSDDGSPLRIGNNADDNRTVDGIIDEVRISTGSRLAGWIATSYENQRDPAAFYAVGEETAH